MKKHRYQLCDTFHNEIHPRENNLILIPSGQTNTMIFSIESDGQQFHYQQNEQHTVSSK